MGTGEGLVIHLTVEATLGALLLLLLRFEDLRLKSLVLFWLPFQVLPVAGAVEYAFG